MAGVNRLVRYRLTPQVDVNEATQTQTVVQRLFERKVCQVEPVLDAVDAQHALQPNGGKAITGFGAVGLDDLAQGCQRNDDFYGLQELDAPPGLDQHCPRQLTQTDRETTASPSTWTGGIARRD